VRRIRRVWAQRVEAEYRSAAHTAELLHWLIACGASPDTLTIAQRIVSDELAHAELCREVLIAAGGHDGQVQVRQEELFLGHGPGLPVLHRALWVVAELFCCGETVAVPLFHAMRGGATAAEAVVALDRIQRDEAVHRAFGWTTLDELLELAGEPGRALVQGLVPSLLERVQQGYSSASTEHSELHAAWGLLAGAAHGPIVARCVAEVIAPRFRERGLLSEADAEPAPAG
jgi:hypothetical protein